MGKPVVPKWLYSFINTTRCCRTLQRLLLTIFCGTPISETNRVCDNIFWGE